MKERDYVIVSALAQARAVRTLLLDLTAQPLGDVMLEGERQVVHRIVKKWEERLSGLVKVKAEVEDGEANAPAGG